MDTWLADLLDSSKSTALWSVTTIGSLVLGAFFGSFYQRARPRINIEQIEISHRHHNKYTDHRVVIPANEAIRRIVGNKWRTGYNLRNPTAKLSEVVEELTDFDENITATIQDLNGLAKSIDQMIELVGGHPRNQTIAERFFDLWEANNRVIL